jgi:site-specific recombinase XerD
MLPIYLALALAVHLLLRHTMLTEANDRSGDLRTVQEIARHMRPETTAGYTRASDRRLRNAVAAICYGVAS